VRSIYCKFSTSKIQQHQPTTSHQPKKNTFSAAPPKNEVKNEHKKYIILKKL
jgi:hypothetical protein